MQRSYCGLIDLKSVDEKLIIKGWVNTRRDHGGVIFIDLRDHTGLVQVIFNPEEKEVFEAAQTLRSEYVLEIHGIVKKRLDGTDNPEMSTGEIEIIAKDLTILNTSKTTPFKVNDDSTNEDLRLQYRYVDLRSTFMQQNLRFRSKLFNVIRNHLNDHEFNEIETPILTKPTPEGARDYIVPSRVHKGSFFALPQSPQLFKQMLMMSGLDRYYQIAKCFRDEDLRADRQPEFTQLDIECSFYSEEDIMHLSESLMQKIFTELIDKDMTLNFPKITYKESMERYGCDKPDLRNPLHLEDVSHHLINTDFKVFKDCVNNPDKRIVALNIPGGSKLTRKNIDDYTDIVKTFGAKGLAFLKIENIDNTDTGISSPIKKFLSSDEIDAIIKSVQPSSGDLIFFSADTIDVVNNSMSNLISKIGSDLDLIKSGFQFAWIIDYPMFEYEKGTTNLTSLHHPFTSPVSNNQDFNDQTLSRAYDLTLNGNEIGGGSVRIHEKSTQLKVFNALKLTDSEIDSKFGFFLKSLEYGCPPHAGIAFGLDRIVMLLRNLSSIRDTIAFPKTQSSSCLLTEAPTEIDSEQLKELAIKTNKLKT
ncbi:MAG: aspartate--tRNA ligase [Pseudomonadota bacterium]|nr:aspartate--tRNA ligase [Pseudomonadota bacterium]